MARLDNPFALLGEDDDGSDISALVAKAEAKISPSPLPEQPKPKASSDGFPFKPLPPAEYVRAERGRGRGGRGRGFGRAGFESAGAGGNNSAGQFGERYSRGFGGDSNGQGRGRGVGRGGRGRGRGRAFSDDRTFGKENQSDAWKENQGQNGDVLMEGAEVQGKSHEFGDNRQSTYEIGKLSDGNMGSGWDEKGYEGDNRRFRGGRARDGRGLGAGFRGPRGSSSGQRYGGRDGGGDGKDGGWTGPQKKEDIANEEEQAGYNALSSVIPSGWDMPEATEVPKEKDAELEKGDPKEVVTADVPEDKPQEEEDNEMTLDEYEKVLQEKRKALESLKTEERKVAVDKEFETMLLVEKKKEDNNFIKLKMEKDKLKKKDSTEKEEKVRKSVSINEFLKPAEGESYVGPAASGRGRGGGSGGRGRGRGERRGGARGGYSGQGGHVASVTPAPLIEDPGQFPLLGAVAKA